MSGQDSDFQTLKFVVDEQFHSDDTRGREKNGCVMRPHDIHQLFKVNSTRLVSTAWMISQSH